MILKEELGLLRLLTSRGHNPDYGSAYTLPSVSI